MIDAALVRKLQELSLLESQDSAEVVSVSAVSSLAIEARDTAKLGKISRSWLRMATEGLWDGNRTCRRVR